MHGMRLQSNNACRFHPVSHLSEVEHNPAAVLDTQFMAQDCPCRSSNDVPAYLAHVEHPADVLGVLLIQQHQPAGNALLACCPDSGQHGLPISLRRQQRLQRRIAGIPGHCSPLPAWETLVSSPMTGTRVWELRFGVMDKPYRE